MDINQFTKILEALAAVIAALGWPLVVIFLILFFGNPLKKFLGDIGEFTFKASAAGLEASAKRKQIEAAAYLGAASVKTNEASENKTSPEEKAREIANVVSQSIKSSNIARLSEASILWVDDRPSNNDYERRSLEALGMHIATSTSTEDALEKIGTHKYDVIISDMGRPPDPQAGYTLLEEIRKRGYSIPYIIYAGSNLPEHKAETRRRGGFGSTNNPQELFQSVLSAVLGN